MQSLTEEENVMKLTTAIALPMALKVSMELGLLDILDKGGPGAVLSPSEIAVSLLPPPRNHSHASQMIDRVLRLLSSYSIVTCSVGDGVNGEVRRLYSLTSVARYFIQGEGNHGSLASMFNVIHDKFIANVWYHMKDATLEGTVPFNQAYGMAAKDAIPKDERFAPVFGSAMRDFNPLFMKKVLDVYKGFEGLESIVDVGGENGSILREIISKYPTIRGINFDLPHIIEKQPISPDIEHVAGNMFTTIPTGDAIFMKWVLRHLDDEKFLFVLKNCFEALPAGGKLIIVELVIPDIPDTCSRSVFQFDLFLTCMNAEGKERTTGEYQALARAAGFSSVQASVRAYDMSLLEFHKPTSSNQG